MYISYTHHHQRKSLFLSLARHGINFNRSPTKSYKLIDNMKYAASLTAHLAKGSNYTYQNKYKIGAYLCKPGSTAERVTLKSSLVLHALPGSPRSAPSGHLAFFDVYFWRSFVVLKLKWWGHIYFQSVFSITFLVIITKKLTVLCNYELLKFVKILLVHNKVIKLHSYT